MIKETTKDIEFDQESIVFFGKIKADNIFGDSSLRKQLNEIITYHQDRVSADKRKIHYHNRVIKQIDTPLDLDNIADCERRLRRN